jgi:hypothetical protein
VREWSSVLNEAFVEAKLKKMIADYTGKLCWLGIVGSNLELLEKI